MSGGRRRRRAAGVARWSAALAALLFGWITFTYVTLPDVRPLARRQPESTAFIELRRGEAEARGRALAIRRRVVPYGRISPYLKQAVIAAEDGAFFQHDGIDLYEIRASMEVNWEEGQFVRGASTITQQLAKNLYLSPSRNPMRKLTELWIARRLEAELSKHRILEIYLNAIEWGDGIFGCEAASRAYFDKPASALSASEAALLAGAIINPRVLNPGKPSRRLVRRQQIILRRMRMAANAPESDPTGRPADRTTPA